MQTVRFHETGTPDVLVLDDVAEPIAGPGEIIVRVEAAGVNFADILRRRGDPYPAPTPLPFTLGSEVAGTVHALGTDVTKPAIGTNVFVPCREGGYAQYVKVAASAVLPLPEGIDAVRATALVTQGLTAYLALTASARFAPGDTVLVEAAAGGVGSFAVQLAKVLGAGKVIAAASTPDKRALALALGADAAVDYTDPGWADQVKDLTSGQGVDIVLEMTGGETFARALDAMGPFGRMVVYGLASGATAQVDPQVLLGLNQSITGFYLGGFYARSQGVAAELDVLVDLVRRGSIALQIGGTFPLAEAVQAHRYLENRKSIGKLVLLPWPRSDQ